MDPSGVENSVSPISISITPAPATGSAADVTGYMVQVCYTQAPDILLFTSTFPTQDVAQKVYEDLCNVAAECEGEIKKEDFEKAQASTKAFMDKCKANSSTTPTQQAQNAPVTD